MGGVIVVEANQKASKVTRMFAVYARNQLFRRDAFLLGAQHDWCAMRVIGAHVPALLPGHLLETNPDVGLNVFHQVAEMDGTVGVGEGGGDEDFARHGDGSVGVGDQSSDSTALTEDVIFERVASWR